MTLRTVGVRLTAEIGEYQSKLRAAGQTTRDFKGELDKAAKKGSLDQVTKTAAGVGVALTGMAAYAIKSAADFDKSMSAVAAATHAPVGEIAKLRAAALQAGKDTQYSATQAADGITELSKAGVSTADVLNGGLKGALSLAAAGQLSVGEAAETAASAMTQFKLKGDQIPHVADLLAAAAGKAQGSVHDMGYALNQSGLVAAQFGLSIEDTTGALAEFASAGLTGSDAGTSFKTMLLALANPSGQTRDLMHELGISFYDAQGKFIGLSGVAQVLQTRLKGLTDQQRQTTLGQIFGSDAIRTASILYTDGAKGVDKWKAAVNDAGYASDTAAKLTDNLAGDIERLKGSVETLAISSGSGANGGLRILTKGLNDVVNSFLDLPPAVGSTITVLAGLGGATLLGLAGFIKLRKGVAEAAEQLASMGPAGEKAAGALGKVSSVAGKATLVLAGLETIQLVADHFAAASANVDNLTDSLTNFSNTGKTAGALSDTFGENLKDLGKNAQTADAATHGFWGGLNDLTTSIPGVHAAVDGLNESIYGLSFNKAKDNMAALDQALTSFMTTSGDARKSSELWSQVLEQSGLDAEQLAKLLPNAYKEVGALNTAADQGKGSLNGFSGSAAAATGNIGDLNSALKVGADAQGQYKTEADAVAGAARGEHAALGALYSQLKAETDPVFALIDAQQKLKAAQDTASKAIKQHGANSAQAKAADLQLAQAALGLQMASGNLANSFNGKLDPAFRQTLHAAGLTDAQINDVGKQFAEAKKKGDAYAKKYAGNVSLTGAAAVATKLEGLSKIQQALAKGTKIPINPSTFFHGLAEGGWTGPGSKYQPAGIVHADEYVIKADSRRSIESAQPGLLDSMNKTGSLPGHAAGGRVWPYPTTAAHMKIPSQQDVISAMVGQAPGGIGGNVAQGGGPGYRWMEAAVRAAFPGMAVYSDYRPGAITLTGNRSYHSVGRAVDFAPSKPLAEWINAHFMKATKELITPWQSLNIHNGARHQYSALVENEHNFAGGNAHDHWAMANGGTITEPIFGIGASGRTYSFGENGVREQVIPHWRTSAQTGGDVHIHASFSGPVGSRYELENWFTGVYDKLRQRGRVG